MFDVMNQWIDLYFGAGIHPETRADLEHSLPGLLPSNSFRKVEVTSFYHADEVSAARGDTLHLILMHRHMVVYAPGRQDPDPVDVIAHIRENSRTDQLKQFRAHYADKDYRHHYNPIYLEILPFLIDALKPGHLVSYDLSSQEIRISRAHHHPGVDSRFRVERGVFRVRNQMSIPIEDRWTGPSLRCCSTLDFDGYLDSFCGFVRDEHLNYNPANMVQHISRSQKYMVVTAGCASQRDKAEMISFCEAAERYQIQYPPRDVLVYGSYERLAGCAVDPMEFGYQPVFPHPESKIYTPRTQFHWAWADDLSSGQPVLVPAQEVSFGCALLPDETMFFLSNTSGAALGGSYEEAILYGLCEAIERDASMTAWHMRRVCPRLDPESVGNKDFQMLLCSIRYLEPAYDFFFFDITNDAGIPAVWAMAVRRDAGPGVKTLSTSACRFTYEKAMCSALEELVGIMNCNDDFEKDRPRYEACLEDPWKVADMYDHCGVYALDEAFSRFDHFPFDAQPIAIDHLPSPLIDPNQDRYNLRDLLETLTNRLAEEDMRVLVHDLTNKDFAARQQYCVKTAVTGLIPLYFGKRNLRFPITDRIRRLARRWGLPQPGPDTLELRIHPFS